MIAKVLACLALGLWVAPRAVSLPPPEDLPEEVLRTEIVTEARSPEDGSVLTAAEYAEVQAEIAEREFPPTVNADLQHTIFLLRVLKLFNAVTPL
ncbi:hypothetical protein Lepto7376_0120 [[Leptolyngbya] sp. PCC 7376]|nr:hypothetical protein Lepto7376_0120 [[Leptolyngbya] sp. PCC 7376]